MQEVVAWYLGWMGWIASKERLEIERGKSIGTK